MISLRDRFLSSFFLEKETYDRVRLARMIYVTASVCYTRGSVVVNTVPITKRTNERERPPRAGTREPRGRRVIPLETRS